MKLRVTAAFSEGLYFEIFISLSHIMGLGTLIPKIVCL